MKRLGIKLRENGEFGTICVIKKMGFGVLIVVREDVCGRSVVRTMQRAGVGMGGGGKECQEGGGCRSGFRRGGCRVSSVEGMSTRQHPWVNNIKMILCHGKTKTRFRHVGTYIRQTLTYLFKVYNLQSFGTKLSTYYSNSMRYNDTIAGLPVTSDPVTVHVCKLCSGMS